jgi:hypothetical protein
MSFFPRWYRTCRRAITPKRLLVAWIVLFSVVVVLGLRENRRLNEQTRELVFANRILAQEGKQAHDSICSLKADYRERIPTLTKQVKASEAFLKEHPKGLVGRDGTVLISRKLLQDSVANQKRTFDLTKRTLFSLRTTKCAKEDLT